MLRRYTLKGSLFLRDAQEPSAEVQVAVEVSSHPRLAKELIGVAGEVPAAGLRAMASEVVERWTRERVLRCAREVSPFCGTCVAGEVARPVIKVIVRIAVGAGVGFVALVPASRVGEAIP